MSSDNNHYVPKLYLRHFASGKSGEDIINFYHLLHHYAKRDIGLKRQCTGFKFYGETDDLEKSLEKYETSIAPFLRQIVASSTFTGTTDDDRRLKLFIALQMVRTAGAAERLKEGMTQVKGHIEPLMASKDRHIAVQNPRTQVILSMSHWKNIADCINDLGIKLLINQTDIGFVTSDNPVVKYNQYCEMVKGMGLVGAACTGLQMMLPLSPKHLFFLFDKDVYKVADKDSSVITTTRASDVLTLNMMQAVQAEEKLLFADWSDLPHIEATARRAVKYRKQERTRVIEIPSKVKANTSSLLHLQDVQRNIELDLSFMELKRNARRLSIEDRINSYRESCPRGAYINQQRRLMREAPGEMLSFSNRVKPGWRRQKGS